MNNSNIKKNQTQQYPEPVNNLDESREDVRRFYSNAAANPQENLCCPVSYPEEDTEHIPSAVLVRFYGCGSPVAMAGINKGETMIDLGAGAGIDCFIASKKVGENGAVIGIDMTDNMLDIANSCKNDVIRNLGYDNVEFKKGYLENIPANNSVADLITSNCVINLSADKNTVFSEMWRVLRDNGRIVISDIVSEKEVPSHIISNKQLWGECIAGALTEEKFMRYLEQAGFYGLQILNKSYWKTIENYKFYSTTIRGYKFQKSTTCKYDGQKAVYLGPFKVTYDDEGHRFSRGEAVEICTDTAKKLSQPPYKGFFKITANPDGDDAGNKCCNNSTGCC